ncbi:MAG: hypothetical protein KKB37_09570, partial [Alphaproteobacteria bacterium]|nr:hypothetical protein [Alphaproteobacteria bacterium]
MKPAPRLIIASLKAPVAALVSLLLVAPSSTRAETPLELVSPLGSYLAGRIAHGENDTMEAVRFYRHALAAQPDNPSILERSFLVEATEGNSERAVAVAKKLINFEPEHRLARAWLGLAAYKAGNYKTADQHFRLSSAGPIGELTSALARAWVAQRRGNTKLAFARLKYSQRAEWAQYYLRYHRALIADIARQRSTAQANYSRIFKSDARMPRVTISYLHSASNAGKFSLVGEIIDQNQEATTGAVHPAVAAVAAKIGKSNRLPLLVRTADEGLAEVFYGLGEALTTEGGMQLGAIYLQMALYLKPDFPFALAALANVYETAKHHDVANAVYEKIPSSSPLKILIDIRRASNLDAMKRTDEARDLLVELAKRYPEDIRPVEALANLLRGRERFKEAIKYYDEIIAGINEPEANDWTYWY